MELSNLRTVAFWADLLLTVVSLVLATGMVTNTTWVADMGWITAILTTLGYHAFNIGTKPAAPPAA